MEYKVGIYDSNQYYMIGLMEFINEQHGKDMRAICFSSVDAISEYVEKENLDIILVDYDVKGLLASGSYADTILYLVDSKDKVQEGIYKYQSLENIYNMIAEITKKYDTRVNADNKLIAVYSPVGRSGKTRLSKSLCEYFDDCIYVRWDEYNEQLSEEHRKWFDEFMFCLVQQNNKIKDIVHDVKEYKEQFDNKFAIEKELCYRDTRMIDKTNLEWLKNLFLDESECKFVFDIGVGALKDINVLNAFDFVFVPTTDDNYAKNKIGSFLKCIKKNRLNREKFKLVNVADIYERKLLINEIVS